MAPGSPGDAISRRPFEVLRLREHTIRTSRGNLSATHVWAGEDDRVLAYVSVRDVRNVPLMCFGLGVLARVPDERFGERVAAVVAPRDRTVSNLHMHLLVELARPAGLGGSADAAGRTNVLLRRGRQRLRS